MDLQAEAARVLDEAEAMLPHDLQTSPTPVDRDAAAILDEATEAVARGEEPPPPPPQSRVRLSYPGARLGSKRPAEEEAGSPLLNGSPREASAAAAPSTALENEDAQAMSPNAVTRQAELSALMSAEKSLAQVAGGGAISNGANHHHGGGGGSVNGSPPGNMYLSPRSAGETPGFIAAQQLG